MRNKLEGTSRPDQDNRMKMKISCLWSRVVKLHDGRLMTLVAEWFSLEEMRALQGVGQRMAQILTTGCGEISRMTGKRICQKEEESPVL